MVVNGVGRSTQRGGELSYRNRSHLRKDVDNLLPRRRYKCAQLFSCSNDISPTLVAHGGQDSSQLKISQ
jgi:hypothetical protein